MNFVPLMGTGEEFGRVCRARGSGYVRWRSHFGRGRKDISLPLPLCKDNDPSRRLMVIANYNNDIAEYWEFSDYYPIDLSNEAYKFGVNYVIYVITQQELWDPPVHNPGATS